MKVAAEIEGWELLIAVQVVHIFGSHDSCGDTMAERLRAAGKTAQPAPAAADPIELFDELAEQSHGKAWALLVCANPRPERDGQVMRAQLIALGARLGWTVSVVSDILWVFMPGVRSTARIRWVVRQDASAMRRLFQEMFGHEMSAEHWDWKYGAGNGSGLALWIDGEMVAHYGGTTRRVRALGEPMLACQVCDVMVSPKGRAALARRGPIAHLTATFLEHRIGHHLPHAIGFGFPSERAFGVAQRLGLYVPVDEVVSLHWNSGRPARRDLWRMRAAPFDLSALQAGSGPWRQVERLWACMALALRASVLGERTPAWLRRRYLDRPGLVYEVLCLTSVVTRRSLGLVVMRLHTDFLEIVDLIGAPRHFGDLIRIARNAAAARGVPNVQAWISASHAHLLRQGDAADATEHKLGIRVPFNAHTAGPDPARFVDKWFLMSGDSDFR